MAVTSNGASEIVVTLNLLPEIAAQLPAEVQALLNAGADALAEDARQTIAHAYPPASRPGEPPALRTGNLQASVTANHDTAPLEATVTAGGGDVDYAIPLELGGARVAARPFMTPAAQRAEPTLQAQLDALGQGLGT